MDESGDIYIKNNDDVLCRTWVDIVDNGAATCTAIAELAIGDSVRVTGVSGNPAGIQAAYSGFAGHIISDNLTA